MDEPRKTLQEFRKRGLRIDSVKLFSRPDKLMSDDKWEADHYQSRVSSPNGNHEDFLYSMGIGHRVYKQGKKYPVKPKLEDLLYSVLLDWNSGVNSFNDFCSDFGYDTDSKKTDRLYAAIQENGEKLKRLFTTGELGELKQAFQDY